MAQIGNEVVDRPPVGKDVNVEAVVGELEALEKVSKFFVNEK